MKNAFGEFVKRSAKLLDVKSIVTLTLTVIFSALALNKVISGEQFLTVFTVVISFYFGTQANKKGSDSDEGKDE